MNIDTIPLFSMLKGKLGYLSQRERVIAQNTANADTPGYTPRDLKPFTVNTGHGLAAAGVAPVRTSSAHMTGFKPQTQGAFAAIDAPDSETTLDGNQVVLEDQMLKMAEARLQYDAAIGFYQKSLSLLRMASKAPGRG
ncbi:MAG: flagellar basal body rod protein FlgB [Caulobacteraceae bacterium]